MDDSIIQRSIRIENDFLSAIEGSDLRQVSTSLEAFEKMWTNLQQDIQTTKKTMKFDDATSALSCGVAERVAVLSESFIDLQTESSAIMSGLLSELDRFLPSTDSSTSSSSSYSPVHLEPLSRHLGSDPDTSSCQLYIAAAYRWLLKNLHDPYPSNEVKNSIARSTNTPQKHINTWFINTRRKIGWTTLARRHFSNSRSETVDAAYRALVKEDPKRPLESNIMMDFMTLKLAAESLYADRFGKSVLVGKLGAAVKDMTDDDLTSCHSRATADKIQRKEKPSGARMQGTQGRVNQKSARSSYPSPDRSIQSSPQPSLSSSSEKRREQSVPSDHVVSRKRRVSMSTSSSDDDVLDTPPDRPMKRLWCVLNNNL
jgi:hypothetical protein